MDEAQRGQVRRALADYGADLERFDDTDLDILWRHRYRSAGALQDATRQSLIDAQLPLAIVDHITSRKASAAGQGVGSTTGAGGGAPAPDVARQRDQLTSPPTPPPWHTPTWLSAWLPLAPLRQVGGDKSSLLQPHQQEQQHVDCITASATPAAAGPPSDSVALTATGTTPSSQHLSTCRQRRSHNPGPQPGRSC